MYSSRSGEPMIKAVIFDMDGTLLDSESVCLLAWQYVIDKYNLDMDLSLPIASIGLNYNSMVRLFLDEFGESFQFEKYWKCAKEFFAEYKATKGVDVKKGFTELANYLKAEGIGMYVATSTYHDNAAENLTASGIVSYFDGIIGGDEITKGKPDPEIFIKAAELTGFSKHECLVVEDSNNGLKAGIASGIRTIYIKDIVDVPQKTVEQAYKSCSDLSDIISVIEQLKRK